MSRQQSYEQQLINAGVDPSDAKETARILVKDEEYPRSPTDQEAVKRAAEQIK